MNGVLNLSVLDGWWIEGFDGENGFSVGVTEDNPVDDERTVDLADAESLYQTLEREVVPCFYSRDERGLPAAWINRMRRALETLTPGFSSDRMLRDYLEKIYN
jgi:starch phosphorylase